MPHSPDIAAYVAIMKEIKRRTAVVHDLLSERLTVMYPVTQVETMVLQVRMILELIALASLAANKTIFEEQAKKFDKHWHPAKILKDIEGLNPGFFPHPIKEAASQQPGVVNALVEVKEGYLTRRELIETHGRCGDILHAKNPYGTSGNYKQFRDQVSVWIGRIIALLNTHQIRLLNHPEFYLIVL